MAISAARSKRHSGRPSSAASSPASAAAAIQPKSNRAAPSLGSNVPSSSIDRCDQDVGNATRSASGWRTYNAPVGSGPQGHFWHETV